MSRFQFYFIAEGQDKTTSVSCKGIRNFGEECWYLFPEEYQKMQFHKALMELSPVKNAVAVLKSRGQFRTVKVTLPDELAKLYRDDDGNFVFKDFLLGEARSGSVMQSAESKIDELVSSLARVAEPKEESVKEILKHFLVEKFSPKNKNVEAWCELFEKESLRFRLSGQKQIEVLKSCLDESMGDWFVVNQRRLDNSAVWKDWKAKLVSTFGDSSWKPVRYAYNFKYISGSYIDYAVKKERMLLELDRKLPDLVILDLIVVGLPSHIQNSLNRNSVINIDLLHSKLKKFEADDRISDSSNKFRKNKSVFNKVFSNQSKNFDNSPKNKKTNVNSNNVKSDNWVVKKPCATCSSRGFPDRFHPESSCWFKDRVGKSVNNVEADSSAACSDEESKN